MQFSTNFIAAGGEYATFEKQVPAPLFRRAFCLSSSAVKAAKVTICGLGFYELYINGQKITRGFLSPYISNPDHYLYYDNYDLSPYLVPGENVIGVMLGNGMQNCFGGAIWDFDKARFRSAPKMALYFECTQEDGATLAFDALDALGTADGFVCTDSPILMDDLRAGEWYDARQEIGDWSDIGYDASNWRFPIRVEAPRGECRIADIDPIVMTEERVPVKIYPSKISYYANCEAVLPVIPIPEDEQSDTGYLYDFGVNAAGVCRIHIKNARPGQKLVLQFGEKMMDGGLDVRIAKYLPHRFGHRDIYICKGGDETWMPTFTYHGFRYVLISGITEEQATPDLLTYIVMNTKLEQRASFRCSDEMTNKLWNAAIVSDLANFYHAPTDCPHREKNWWTGDISLSAEQMVLALSPERNWREWLRNVRKAMKDSGDLPGIVPTDNWGYGEGVAWDNVIVTLPYYTWLYRGDLTLARDNAAVILRYIHFLTTHRNKRGLIEYGLGDWVPAGRGLDYRAPLEFTATVLAMDFCAKAAELYAALNMKAEAAYAETVRGDFYASARAYLIDTGNMTAYGRCQTSQAMAIYYDLFNGAEKPLAIERLLNMINDKQGHFDCGILGMRVIFHVLSAYGHTDLAHRMITRTDFPSYGYEIANDATALWECFGYADRAQSSLNHHFFGDIISWFMQNLTGISVNPHHNDPNEIRIHPRFIDTLTYAEGSYDAPAGTASVHWERDGDDILCHCTLPEGANAEFICDIGWQIDDGYTHKRFIGSAQLRLIRENKRDRFMR